MSDEEKDHLVSQLDDKIARLTERERDLAEQAEELAAQKEELTAAIEEVVKKNRHLEAAVDQLKERNFELDQILYRISHDLRAPVVSIKGILLLLGLEQLPDPIKTYSSHIEGRITQMDHILRSLASLSKSILEKAEYCTVSLQSIIDHTVARHKSLAVGQPVTVQRNLAIDHISSDAYLLEVIIHELIGNAYIFRDTSMAGQITITASVQNDTVCIEIADNGEGLSAEILPHIFNIFYRGSERSRGAGLGLYIAKKAAAQLGGKLTALSDGSGSIFTVYLPCVELPASA